MNINKLSILACAIALATGLTGCSGSDSTSAATTSTGVITGFGSIFVNGIEYDTSNSDITRDGVSVTEDALAVGMVVDVRGSHDSIDGIALSIDASDELEGVLQSTSIATGATTGSVVIMGQTVNVDNKTIFESKVSSITAVDGMSSGNIIEVHGFTDGMGEIFASRIEVKAVDLATYLSEHEDMEVKGIVTNLDTTALTFTLGNMTVNYANADNQVSNLTNGLYVEVKSVAGIDGNNQLIASKVEIEDDGKVGHHGDEDEEFEIKGVISSAFESDMFTINGITVLVNEQTKLDGLTTASLTSGSIIEVEGIYDADGKLIASKIEAEDDADTEIKSTISEIISTGVNTGTITLSDANNTVVVVTSNTLMKDSRDQGIMPEMKFNLTFLTTGDYIEIDAFTNADGNLEAAKIEREDD